MTNQLYYSDGTQWLPVEAPAGTGGSTDPELVRDTIAAALREGTGVSITVDDPGDTITISATGATDPEVVRDVVGAALVQGAGISISVNDAGDTITIANTRPGIVYIPAGGTAADVPAGTPTDTFIVERGA